MLTSQEHYLFPTARPRTTCSTSAARSKRKYLNKTINVLITSVQQLVKQFISEKELLIDAVKAEHTDEARQYIEEGKGRTLMLKIRRDMGRFRTPHANGPEY